MDKWTNIYQLVVCVLDNRYHTHVNETCAWRAV